jgi:hypothetical protein
MKEWVFRAVVGEGGRADCILCRTARTFPDIGRLRLILREAAAYMVPTAFIGAV